MKTAKVTRVIIFVAIALTVLLAVVVILKQKENQNTVHLLIVGDSIGEGAGASDPSLKWYKYLIPYTKDTYGVKLDITNISMSGNTSYAGYARVMELDSKKKYDLAIVCYGENDKPENFSLYYESILQAINSKYPACRLITILESSQREYTDKMKTIQNLSEHYHASIADTIAAFKECGRPYEELCEDGTHPNDEGQKVYYETIKPLIDAYFTKRDQIKEQKISGIDVRLDSFQRFTYYPFKDFKKVADNIYELDIKHSQAMIGIDYSTVKGIHDITVIIDEQKKYNKNIGWENDFALDFIELIAEDCEIQSKLQLVFSSQEQAEAFHGITINYKNQ